MTHEELHDLFAYTAKCHKPPSYASKDVKRAWRNKLARKRYARKNEIECKRFLGDCRERKHPNMTHFAYVKSLWKIPNSKLYGATL